MSSKFLQQLQDNMRTALPPAYEFHSNRSAYKPDNLVSTGYVNVHHDAHCRSLHLLYDGPFKILEAHDKYYMFNVNGHHHGVFINQLKTEYSKRENCKSFPVPPWPVTPYLTRGTPSPPKKQQTYRAISLRKTDKYTRPIPVCLGGHSITH